MASNPAARGQAMNQGSTSCCVLNIADMNAAAVVTSVWATYIQLTFFTMDSLCYPCHRGAAFGLLAPGGRGGSLRPAAPRRLLRVRDLRAVSGAQARLILALLILDAGDQLGEVLFLGDQSFRDEDAHERAVPDHRHVEPGP